MELIKFYFIGLVILVVAILANFLAAQLGLKTWYDFLNQWGGANAINFKDGIWLFILYPIILGCSTLLGNVIWKSVF